MNAREERERDREEKKFSSSKLKRKNKIVSTLSREKGQSCCSSSSNDDDGGSGQKHEIASCLSSSRLGDTLSIYIHICICMNERT
jgi:hypothetical protein